MNREKSPLIPLLDSHLTQPAAMITRLLILLLLLTATAASQPRWEFVEAWGGETGEIIPLPDGTLLTSSSGGIYASSNKGKEWSLVAKKRHHLLLGISPTTGTLIAMGPKKMLFSTDYGRSWGRATVDSIHAESHLSHFTVTGDGTFYAASNVLSLGQGGVFRSTDDGRSWSCIGLPGRRFDALLLTKDGTLIAATDTVDTASAEELYVSTDGGTTWSEGRPVPWVDQSGSLDMSMIDLGLLDLDIDSVGALYAVTAIGGLYAVTSIDIWKSTDLGVTWRLNLKDAVDFFRSLTVAPDGTIEIMGRRGGRSRHSRDGGKSWTDGPPRLTHPDGEVIALGPVDLFVPYSDAGILYSSDSGKSWERRNHGIPATIHRMSAAGGRIVVNATGEHRTSADGGATWQFLPSYKKYASYQRGKGVARGISDAGTLFVVDDSTLERSSDGGATWNRLEGSAPFNRFVGNGAGDLFGFALWKGSPYLWIARDDGITWEAHARVDLLRSIRGIVFDGRTAGYAATDKGIVVTRDNGRTWSMVYQSPAHAVTVDKRGSAIVMTDSGVVRSDDHGRSWQVIADTTLRFTELATARDGSIIGYRDVQGIDTSYDGSLFSHTKSHEIWRSTDRGATWKLFSEGLPDSPILSFTADRSTGAVYVATEGGGLFRMVDTER